MYFCNKGKDLGIQFSSQSNSLVFIVRVYSIRFADNKAPPQKKYFAKTSRLCPKPIIRNRRMVTAVTLGRQREDLLNWAVGSRSLGMTHSGCPGNACASCSFLELSCRGERIRDYYQKQQGYAACQTTKKVSRLECRGGCTGGQCCGPLRSKRRKYSFECTDGSSFVDEVEKVVKCGCTRCAS